MSLCSTCKFQRGRQCGANGQGERLLERGAMVRVCDDFRGRAAGKRQLIDSGGRIGGQRG